MGENNLTFSEIILQLTYLLTIYRMLLCYKQNYVKTQLDDDIMIQEMVLRFVF